MNINPIFLLALAQRETQLLSTATFNQVTWAQMTNSLGDSNPNATNFYLQITWAAKDVQRFMTMPLFTIPGTATSIPVPVPDGPFFFPGRSVPIDDIDDGQGGVYTRVLGYGPPDECTLTDAQISDRYNVAFTVPDRPSFVVFMYNPWVQACEASGGNGGGNKTLASILNTLHNM